MHKNICFTYYADDKWIGWYGGTFGPVSNVPKVYTYSLNQIEIVKKNFNTKIRKIKENSLSEYLKTADNVYAAIGSLVFSSEELLKDKKIELRIVECPFYDGPNPDFKLEEYEELSKKRLKAYREKGIDKIEDISERIEAIKRFEKLNPQFKYPLPNWIFPDPLKVKEWASVEPTEFLSVITPEL